MISLSTAWNADKWLDGEAIAEEIHSLGFQGIECNFSLTNDLLEGVIYYAHKHGLSFTSLHNYCPTPPGLKREEALPDCYSLSSLSEEERCQAVCHTKTTIRTASRLKAKAVVLHTGRVEMKDRTRELIKLATQGLKGTPEFNDILNSFAAERKRKSQDFFSSLLKSLDELVPFAQELNVALGIENRFYYREIPSLDEFETIFDQFKDMPISYWHDVGHSYIFEQLGLIPTDSLLERFGNRLIGLHLHNVKNLNDHQAPVDGDFDFTRLAPFVRKDTIRVIEAHQHVPAEAIRRSAELLETIFHD
jgi:sugar phosphate isomerase/epimerase